MSDLPSVEATSEAIALSTAKPAYWPSETVEDYDERLSEWLRGRDVERDVARAYAEGRLVEAPTVDDQGATDALVGVPRGGMTPNEPTTASALLLGKRTP